jgi:hypothetical protein
MTTRTDDLIARLNALCADDDTYIDARNLLIDDDHATCDPSYIAAPTATRHRALHLLIHELHMRSLAPHDESATQSLSLLYLDFSLCPMHHCDYAICFDDDDDECATIRAFFPIHDT